MQSLILQEKNVLSAFFADSNDIGIVIGNSGNKVDNTAAALSLYLSLKNAGKNVQIISLSDPIVEESHLVGIDNIEKSFSGNVKTLTISVPYVEGEIDKVSYNIEKDRLNVNLFAQTHGISFSEKDINYIKQGAAPSSIITLGVRLKSDLMEVTELKEDSRILQIDLRSNDRFGSIALIDPTYSSVSEAVTELLYELAFPVDADTAQNLLDGIVAATDNFSKTASMFAFQFAGLLMQSGAQRRQVERIPQAEEVFPQAEELLKPRDANYNQKVARDFFKSSAPAPVTPAPSSVSNQPSPEEVPQGETTGGEVPSDWFLPKVFKGSRKGN